MKKLIIAGIIVAICTACGGGSSIDKSLSKVNKEIGRASCRERV